MASSNPSVVVSVGAGNDPESTSIDADYFVITVTNYPRLLKRTPHYQQLLNDPQDRVILPRSIALSTIPDAMEMDSNFENEQYLYEALKYQLERIIRIYLEQTRRPYPISFVFNLSHIHPKRE